MEYALIAAIIVIVLLCLYIAWNGIRWGEAVHSHKERADHYETNYTQMASKAVRLENALSDAELKLQRSKQLNDDLQHEIDTFGNEHKRVTEERDALARTVIHGSKKYELTAVLNSHVGPDGGKFSRHSLDLVFLPPGTGRRPWAKHPEGSVVVEVRSLSATNKNKTELQEAATKVNRAIGGFIDAT